MFQKRFVEPILVGTKCQTIRPKRKQRRINVGEELSLRYWESVAYRSRQVEFAKKNSFGTRDIQVYADDVLTGKNPTSVGLLNVFAVSDGFQSWKEMREFFGDFYGFPFFGDLILWEPANA